MAEANKAREKEKLGSEKLTKNYVKCIKAKFVTSPTQYAKNVYSHLFNSPRSRRAAEKKRKKKRESFIHLNREPHILNKETRRKRVMFSS